MNIQPDMTREAALELARHPDALLAALNQARLLPAGDPAPFLELAEAMLTAALADALAREGEAFDADKARLQAEVDRLTRLLLGDVVVAPGEAA